MGVLDGTLHPQLTLYCNKGETMRTWNCEVCETGSAGNDSDKRMARYVRHGWVSVLCRGIRAMTITALEIREAMIAAARRLEGVAPKFMAIGVVNHAMLSAHLAYQGRDRR